MSKVSEESLKKARETLYGDLPVPDNPNAKLWLIRNRDIPFQSIENVIHAFALALDQAKREQAEKDAGIARASKEHVKYSMTRCGQAEEIAEAIENQFCDAVKR